ncbi:MAG: DUF3857 domain-containing protein [Chitinophagaceae bacterium]|nr:MAG: DUF3857 domain-containing protein [Chitinophagaceae bacterium]
MSKLIIFVTAILLGAVCTGYDCRGQEFDLAADKIPDSLVKNAVSILRFEKKVFEVTDLDQAIYKIHNAVTILNERGSRYQLFQHYGDKFHKLGDVNIRVYDANGKFLIRFKNKDLSTYNIGEGLIDDGIRQYIMVPAAAYPITVETDYEIIYRGLLAYPSYYFANPNMAVINSSFTAIVPKVNNLRYKPQHTSILPEIKEDGKNISYTWSVKNQAAVAYEDGAIESAKMFPAILLAPNKFKLDNYEGDLSSWKNFGLWYSSVVDGTDVLKEPQINFYKNLVKHAATNREKIETVYKYMQSNFRYVSIQLGIGGNKPLPASFTDDKKYGDCKGLSNYMRAVLKTFGIKSHLAIINREANDDGEDPNFPIDRFNHVILFVPDGKDSIWLECTSKTLPFGMLDFSTENKNAVVVTENGGVLVATPRSRAADNVFKVRTAITLDGSGSGDCISNMQATGFYKEMLLENVAERKRDEQKAFLVGYFGYKQMDDLVITRIADPYIYNTNLALAIEKVSEFSAGSKMFLAPHIYKFVNFSMPAHEKRQRDFYFTVPFIKSDTTIFTLPEGFIIDQLPVGKTFATEVGSYSSTYSYNDSQKAIYSITSLELNKHKILPGEYDSTKAFFDKVLKEESQRIVIKKDPNQPPPPPRKSGF